MFNFLAVPAQLIFHRIKIGRFVRADKATAMENAGLTHAKKLMLNKEKSRPTCMLITFVNAPKTDRK